MLIDSKVLVVNTFKLTFIFSQRVGVVADLYQFPNLSTESVMIPSVPNPKRESAISGSFTV